MKKIWLILLGILGGFFVVNLFFLDWWLFGGGKLEVGSGRIDSEVGSEKTETIPLSCELSCQEIIEEKIKEELARLPSPAGQSSVASPVPRKPAPTTSNGKPKVVYVPLVAGGSVSSASWTDVVPSEFYFNLADYPSAKEVRFEAYLSSLNDDQGYSRLYDATNKRGVDFSDLLFSKSAFTRVESSAIKIWAGNNKYTVQLRSVNATLVQIKEAKLKVIY